MLYVDFWVVVATTVPVLALALVVQARDEVRKAQLLPQVAIRLIALNHAFALVVGVVLMFVALSVLTGQMEPTRLTRLLATGGTIYLTSMTIFVPATNWLLFAFTGVSILMRGEVAIWRIRVVKWRVGVWKVRFLRRDGRVRRKLSRQVDLVESELAAARDPDSGMGEAIRRRVCDFSERLRATADAIDLSAVDREFMLRRFSNQFDDLVETVRSSVRSDSEESLQEALVQIAEVHAEIARSSPAVGRG